MKATVSYEETGKTPFDDPIILVTVQEPHPWAGKEFLLKSTASMEHYRAEVVKTGKSPYLVYANPHDWHGATRNTTLEDAVQEIAEYVDWLYQREQIRDYLDTSTLREHLSRFDEGLYENNTKDYKEEWQHVLEEVARINLVMEGVKESAGGLQE